MTGFPAPGRVRSLREIAAEIGVSRETVRKDELRALAKLRAELRASVAAPLPPEPEEPRDDADRRARKRAAAVAWYAQQPMVAVLSGLDEET